MTGRLVVAVVLHKIESCAGESDQVLLFGLGEPIHQREHHHLRICELHWNIQPRVAGKRYQKIYFAHTGQSLGQFGDEGRARESFPGRRAIRRDYRRDGASGAEHGTFELGHVQIGVGPLDELSSIGTGHALNLEVSKSAAVRQTYLGRNRRQMIGRSCRIFKDRLRRVATSVTLQRVHTTNTAASVATTRSHDPPGRDRPRGAKHRLAKQSFVIPGPTVRQPTDQDRWLRAA